MIVYFYAGVAKINEDWLRAEPMKHWLAMDAHKMHLLRYLVGDAGVKVVSSELSAYLISYTGLVFDIVIGFILLWGRGWIWILSLVACITFHIMNKMLFSIGKG